ncbi:MAG TPA: hypothetical protein VFE58_18515 [Tepidisphaeraceae bacterium]|jgi:hypothetical protein|nr:hypothetical protein [Tepidisphaeraceae bacterium]
MFNHTKRAHAVRLFIAAAAVFIPTITQAADFWTGQNSQQWNDPGNWSAGLPQSADDAINTLGTSILFNTNATINSFSGNAPLLLQSGTLSGSQSSAASTILAAPLSIDGGQLANLTLSAASSVSLSGNGSNAFANVIFNASLSADIGAYLQLYNANTLNGSINLNGGGNGIQFHDGNASLTISSTGTLHGQGQTYNNFGGGTLTNNGLVSADVASATLALNNSNLTGSGAFDARNGATLSIGGLLNGNNASVTVDSTSRVQIDGGGLTGSISSTTGTGLSFSSSGNNYISSASVAGTLTFDQNAYAQLYSSNTLTSGLIRISSTANGIQFHDGNASLTIAAAASLRGYGITYNNFGGGILTNNGTISADIPSQTLYLQNSNLTGSGLFTAENGGTLSISGGATLNGSAASITATAGTVLIDGATVTGSFASSTGTGMTFSSSGNNAISSASITGNLTLPQNAYTQIYSSNTVGGTISLSSTSNGIQFHDGNALLTLSPGATLRGYGVTYNNFGGGTLANNGTISADVSAQTLSLNNSNITGAGVFQAVNGGILSIGGLLTGNAATIHSDTGSVIINGGSVTGTFAASTGNGINFSSNGSNSLSFATINGNLTVAADGYAQIFNTNTVNGTLNMAGTSNGIQLHDGNAFLTIGSSALLRGYGTTYNNFGGGTLINNGSISADTPGQTLLLAHSNTTGSGNFDAGNGGVLSIATSLSANNATLTVDNSPGSAILLAGGTISGTILSSTGSGLTLSSNGNNAISSASLANDITIPSDGYVQLYNSNTISGAIHLASTSNGIQFHDGNTLLNLTGSLRGFGQTYNNFGGGVLNNSGTIAADVPGQTLSISNSFLHNTGSISVSAGATLSIAASLNQSAGSISVDGDLLYSPTLLVSGGTLTGSGTIHTSVENAAGILSPHLLTITSDYQQDPAATFLISLSGTTTYDHLAIGNNASFAGTLDVNLAGGFTPQIGDSFDIATWTGSQTGSFSLTSDTGLQYSADYGSPSSPRLRITLTAIPEPTTFALSAFTSLFLLHRRRSIR